MRRRIGGTETRLGGNSAPPYLDNQPSSDDGFNAIAKQCHAAAVAIWPELEECDFHVEQGAFFEFGIEPSYQGEPLKIIRIHAIKEMSAYITGYAFGYWGAGVRKKSRLYSSYTRQNRFCAFVNEWHPKLFPPVS